MIMASFYSEKQEHPNGTDEIPLLAPVKKKWWVPRDKYKKDLFEKTKRDITHFLAVSQEGVLFSSFLQEFEEVTGSPVPFRDLGFKTVGEMLFHMDEIINVRQDNRHGTLYIYVGNWAPIEDEIVHIRQLVIAQSISDKTKSMNTRGMKGMRLNSHDVPLEILMSAERGRVSNQPLQQRSTGLPTMRMGGYRNQNPARFAPWRDDRVRTVSEAGAPIPSENSASMLSLCGLRLDSESTTETATNTLGSSNMPSTFGALPQYHFQAV